MLKYTLAYDGMYGSCAQTHTEEKYASESLALPEKRALIFRGLRVKPAMTRCLKGLLRQPGRGE
jgi:hypothetical protein